MKFSNLWLAVIASLAIHGITLGSSAQYRGAFRKVVPLDETLQLSYLRRSESETAVSAAPRKNKRKHREVATDWTVSEDISAAPLGDGSVAQAASLLADPAQGEIFSGYFSQVKEKIQRTLRDSVIAPPRGRGAVELFFVLDSDGLVISSGVDTVFEDTSDAIAKFAVRMLKAASPFEPFPADLTAEKIAFTVTLTLGEA